jgi:hypothetical protein
MIQTGLISNAHGDLVTDAVYDFYGLRLATCSLDQRYVLSAVLLVLLGHFSSQATASRSGDWKRVVEPGPLRMTGRHTMHPCRN